MKDSGDEKGHYAFAEVAFSTHLQQGRRLVMAVEMLLGTGANAAALDQGFEYDDLDRLTSFTSSGTTHTYSYDATGNRTSLSIGGASHTNAIAADSNRLLSTTGPVPAKTNTYDLAGNLTSDATVTYTYTARGRMSSATVGTAKTSYLYNGLGERVRQVTGTTVNPTGLLVYDEAGHIIGEYNSSTGKASKEFIYLGDTPVGVLQQVVTGAAPNEAYATNVYFVYTDHLKTPRFITRSPDGQTVWRWDSGDPFGLLPPNDNPAGTGVFSFNLRMPGQYYDKSTNLFYNYFRDYDPQLGRYVESDPIGLNGGINTYNYVEANPASKTDPKGLQSGQSEDLTPRPQRPPLPSDVFAPETSANDAFVDSFYRILEATQIPKTARCKASEFDQCAAKCGGAGKVKGCYVSIRWKTRRMNPGTGGIIKEEQRIVNCNCDCP